MSSYNLSNGSEVFIVTKASLQRGSRPNAIIPVVKAMNWRLTTQEEVDMFFREVCSQDRFLQRQTLVFLHEGGMTTFLARGDKYTIPTREEDYIGLFGFAFK